MVEVKTGWEQNGLPVGKRLFREPGKMTEYNSTDFLKILPLYIISLLYGIFIHIWNICARLLWQKPVSLKGKVCFVTGSGRGVGRELVLELARQGAKIACADINEETNAITMNMLNLLGATAKAYKLNVADKREVIEVAEKVEKDLGPVYLVVNNAAILMRPSEQTEEYVRASFNVNALGPIWVMDAFLPKLMKRNSGHIVNMSSITAYYPVPYLEVYSATKAALSNYTQITSCNLKREGSAVKVTCVWPQFINSSADYMEAIKMKTPPVSLRLVVEQIMYGIAYGLENVSIPAPVKFHTVFTYLPHEAYNLFCNMMNAKAIMPTNQEFEDLPASQLVKACSKEIGKDNVKKSA